MISGAFNIAQTGLRAAEVRLANSANNVANVHSTTSRVNGEQVNEPFKAQQVTQSSLSTGGVRTDLRAVNPESIPAYDPTDVAADAEGITQFPNVNLEEEVINQQIASYDFKANLKVIETTDEMTQDLLNVLA